MANSIERFEAPNQAAMRSPEPIGTWVRYTDHVKEVNKLEAIIASQRHELSLQAKFRQEDKHARQLLDPNACQRRVAELETHIKGLEETLKERKWLDEWSKLGRKATAEEMLSI